MLTPPSPPGKGEEQRAAASLACLLCIQLGSGIESEEVLKSLKPIFKNILSDGAASVQARQAVSGWGHTLFLSGPRHTLSDLLVTLFFSTKGCYKFGPVHSSCRR